MVTDDFDLFEPFYLVISSLFLFLSYSCDQAWDILIRLLLLNEIIAA